ncbi:inactive protein RESTRICTED TEV MOVEMENT 2-like [Momordica charantia]|uniref:Inactive protein RESTRICTED TEV MOVEMENT 2-like n=1 Tax=Momordica charantia TaxID=3673 RepID=A0A6J1BX22_MOMCH|nr:inactive protein RESTRICTED TEV MOVEMENT 2-like [Momordica charantia]
MDWFGKGSKVEDQPAKSDMESLGIRFEPILFYSERNEYELRIELPGCPKDLIKVTYDRSLGKLKLQGQKHKTNFHHQFTLPADCLPTGIYGRFRGDVLHIVIPRLLSDWPASKDASSKQEDDHRETSSDQTTTDHEAEERAGKCHQKLPPTTPAPRPPGQKSTDEVREREGKDRDKLPARVPAPLPSDQKTTDDVRERVETERKLPSKVSAPPTEKSKGRDEELYPEISAPPPPDRESSRSVKELREKYQKKLSEIAAPPPVPPAAAPAPATSNRKKSTDVGAREESEEPPSTVVPASPLSKSGTKVSENTKIFAESKANETEEKKRNAGGDEKLGLVYTVKKTGKAAVAAAAASWKDENRRVVMIGAAVLAIVVIGAASLRSSNKKLKN